MLKFIWQRGKRYLWMTFLVVLLGSLNTIAGQYIYKFIGFMIDYGLHYTGDKCTDSLSFLFSGKFGEYGSLQIIITLAICTVACSLISFISGYMSSYVQMKGQHAIANRLRVDIYNKGKCKKLPYSRGDFIVLLHEDIYHVSYLPISHGPLMISNLISIIVTLLMLNNISPYLLITPLLMLPLLVYFSVKYHKATYKQNSKYREVDGELKETISDVVATSSEENYKQFKKINRIHTDERKRLSHVSNNYSLILNSIKLAIYIVSCTVAGILAIQGKILIGEYLVFTAFINTIYSQLLSFINYIISIRSSQPRIEKVKNLMEGYLNEEK